MGYSTDFEGHIDIEPPLSTEEMTFLEKFAESRRMKREQGPYFVEGSEDNWNYPGVNMDAGDHNHPPDGQPGLWCHWVPGNGGRMLEWDEGEKTYDFAEWLKYLIEHFIGSNPKAKSQLPFLQNHVLNGEIKAEGEDGDDRWDLIVRDNEVYVKPYEFQPGGLRKI